MYVVRLKPILSWREAEVDLLLADYADANGYRILLKTRLRDVIDTDDDSALTKRERDFAFKAHLDFVAADAKTGLPLLAVEYDGPQHWSDPIQQERDAIKDRLCAEAGLDLLRIDNLFTRREGRWRVLGYILEMHEAGKAFAAAQALGNIPRDEPFIHTSIIDTTDPARLTFTGLDTEALQRLQRWRQAGTVTWYAQWCRRIGGRVEACCLLALTNGQFLSSTCAVRQFAIEGITAFDIAEELATAELGWQTQRYDNGEAVALHEAQGRRLLEDLQPRGAALRSRAGWSLNWSAGLLPKSSR